MAIKWLLMLFSTVSVTVLCSILRWLLHSFLATAHKRVIGYSEGVSFAASSAPAS